MLRKYNKKGFSLVELLVVITIIAILSVVAYTAVGGNTMKARDAKRKQDLGTIQQALEIYYAEKGVYPSAPLTYGTGSRQITKKHLSAIPTDPATKQPYFYKDDSTSEYELAAALEMDGDPKNFESYVVSNSSAITMTTKTGPTDPKGKFYNTTAEDLNDCGMHTIATGKIGTSDADGNCIPYDPRP
jgi:prepilin-type N-terminal cleavage/methylation domain-containing protein